MADFDDILSRYGGYESPEPAEGFYDTRNVRARMPQDTALTRAMRGLADYLPADEREGNARGPDEPWANWWARTSLDSGGSTALSGMLKAGLDTGANWLDRRPKIGPDTLAPLGMAAIGSAPAGALAAGAARRAPLDKLRGYHGSDRGFDRLREHDAGGNFPDMNVPHEGVWFADTPERAEYFAKRAAWKNEPGRHGQQGDPASTGPAIYPADLEFKNPYRHSAEAFADEGISSLPSISELREKGHDGVIVPRANWEYVDGKLQLKHLGEDYAALSEGTVTSPLSGNSLFADSSRASLPGTVVNAAQQAPFLERMRQRVKEMQDADVSKFDMRSEIASMRREEYVKLREAGAAPEQIAQELGVSLEHASNRTAWARKGAEAPPRHGGWRWQQFWSQNDPVSLYQQGAAPRDIAERFGVSTDAVYSRLQKAGYGRGDQSRPSGWADRVAEMRRAGESYGDIGKELGMSRNAIAGAVRDLRKKGVTVPSDPMASLPGTILDDHYGDGQQ